MGATSEFHQNQQLNTLIFLYFFTTKAWHEDEGPEKHPFSNAGDHNGHKG